MTVHRAYLLVAERSVIGTIDLVIESLEKHGLLSRLSLVVPRVEVAAFRATRAGDHELVAEEEILPEWPLARIQQFLPRHPDRAGWYLQQFLKLGFGLARRVPDYVVWDADTVMLACPTYERSGCVVMNTSREYHRPYFATFERLLGARPPLAKSVIAQYMLMNPSNVAALCTAIQQRHGRGWIEAILAQLPGLSPSEFSEYETYANFVEVAQPGTVVLESRKWFRYGQHIYARTPGTLSDVERRFSGYGYVSFERHASTPLKRIAAQALSRLKI